MGRKIGISSKMDELIILSIIRQLIQWKGEDQQMLHELCELKRWMDFQMNW
jgi:hypothetical protein